MDFYLEIEMNGLRNAIVLLSCDLRASILSIILLGVFDLSNSCNSALGLMLIIEPH